MIVRADSLEIYLPWFPSRAKMEVVLKGLRVRFRPAITDEGTCLPPTEPKQKWWSTYSRQLLPKLVGMKITDTEVSIIDDFRAHQVILKISSFSVDFNLPVCSALGNEPCPLNHCGIQSVTSITMQAREVQAMQLYANNASDSVITPFNFDVCGLL